MICSEANLYRIMQIWTFASEHKSQSILVLFQMITVVMGMCFVKAIDK